MFKKMLGEIKERISHFSGRPFQATIMLCITAAMLVGVCTSVNTVNIAQGDEVMTVKTLRKNSAGILDLAEIDYRKKDLVNKEANGSRISLTVESAFEVKIVWGENSETVYVTPGMTALEAAELAGIELDDNDTIDIGKDTVVAEGTKVINVNQVDFITETTIKRLYYKTVKVNNPNSSKTVTTTKGSEGKAEVVTVKRYENGVYVGNESVKENVLVAPVDEILSVGTKKAASASASVNEGRTTYSGESVPYDKTKVMSKLTPNIDIQLDKNGVPTTYKKHMTVQATAYSPKVGSHCATGVRVQVGYIAVNPKVIPYGTKMYIVSSDKKYVYGYAIAADTGGFVKNHPTNVDLFMSTEALCNQFGRRNVEIYILN